MAVMTMVRSIAFSRATASAICNSSSRFALTAGIEVSSVFAPTPAPGAALHSSRRRSGTVRFARAAGSGATRGLAAPERLGDQRIGQHQPRLRHLADGQRDLGGLCRRGIVAADARGIALDPEQHAT